MVYEVILTVENVVQIEAVLYDVNNDFVKSVTVSNERVLAESCVSMETISLVKSSFSHSV
jgi:hypothetical protein